MVSEVEIIVERRRFRRRLLFWRVAAAVLLVAALLALAGGMGGFADIAKQRSISRESRSTALSPAISRPSIS